MKLPAPDRAIRSTESSLCLYDFGGGHGKTLPVGAVRTGANANYEVESARCAEGSGEMLVDAALRMLRELCREAR